MVTPPWVAGCMRGIWSGHSWHEQAMQGRVRVRGRMRYVLLYSVLGTISEQIYPGSGLWEEMLLIWRNQKLGAQGRAMPEGSWMRCRGRRKSAGAERSLGAPYQVLPFAVTVNKYPKQQERVSCQGSIHVVMTKWRRQDVEFI